MKEIRKDNGSALVIVLGMLAVLMLMAVAFSVIMRVERAGTTNLRHSLTAQNGLQSAISQALSDIDSALGDDISPQKWKNGIMATQSTGVSYDILSKDDKSSDIKVSILNEKAQRHLNPTTRALVKNAKVDWRLLYAGIPLSNYADGGNRLSEDSIVGRIAYVAVNTTGYLDPNMVSEDGIIAYPEMTHQLNNESFARLNNRNVKFVSSSLLDARESNGRKGFTSFADLVALNESQMYSGGKVKGSPKMYINLFPPNKTSCLFLPDVFGPAATFGMSPYPVRMTDFSEYDDAGFDDWDPLTEAVQLDAKKELTESDIEKIHIAFHSVFERMNWNEKDSYGQGTIKFEKPIRNVEWKFPRVGNLVKCSLSRADLALLSFVEYFSYKNGLEIGDTKYLQMAIDLINAEHGSPINKNKVSFNGNSYGSYLNAPCFKSVPMLSTILGWTDRPGLKPEVIYRHTGGGKFTEVTPETVIEPGTSTGKYYAKYDLPVTFLIWAVNPHGRKAPQNPADMNVTILFGPEADGKDVFKHIQEEISGDPKIILDPEETFRDAVEKPIELSASNKKNTIKVEKELDDVITVYIQHPDIKNSPEDAPLKVSDIIGDFSWEKAKFGTNLADYSIDVFMSVDIVSDASIVQAVPAPRLRKRGNEGPDSYIHFKLPLFRENANEHECHRIGYAMPIDQRFAHATECMNEYRDGALESFPYWVNNVMAEDIGEFSALKSYEMSLDEPTQFTPTSNLAPDPTNPYAKLAMGYGADGSGEVSSDFWDGLMKFDSTDLEYGKPYPDTLHKVPCSGGVHTANSEYAKSDLEVDWGSEGKFDSVGELGMLCIGPWETISLYRTKTPEGEYDFHTVLDFFTLDSPTELIANKINLNAPPLLMTQEGSKGRVKFAIDHGGSYANTESFDIDGKVKIKDYVNASNGLNPEPLMALLYGLEFDYRTSWELASRIIYQNMDLGSSNGVNFFKDISQLGYSENSDISLLKFLMDEDNATDLDKAGVNVYSDQGRESIISRISPYVTTRGQTFTIVIRSDAFAPKYGSDVDGTTLASKVAVVEAWRDTEPARDSEGNSLGYHNWHIRSVRIVD